MNKFILFGLLVLTSVESYAITAEDLALEMNIDGIDFVYPFNESTDPNNQLGRPNQYVEKVSWPDKRIDPHDFDGDDGNSISDVEPTHYKGGTIEKFRTQADLNRRYNYIKNINLNVPMLNQYMYKKGLFLMRLDKDFTPTQAKEYEREFNHLVK